MSHRVLVVDDELDIREIARLALERLAGWRVLTAGSGEEAIVVAAAEQPEAVLLDVMMPGLDGLETARRLAAQETTARIPVVLLTARARSAERAELEHAPVVGVLTKPFDPATLARDVEQILGWAP